MNCWNVEQWTGHKWEICKSFRSFKQARAFAKYLAGVSANRYEVRIMAIWNKLWQLQSRRGKKTTPPKVTFLNGPLEVIQHHKKNKTFMFSFGKME